MTRVILRPATESEIDCCLSLLEESFPANERRPRDAQKALWANPRYTPYILPAEGENGICALLTAWQLDDLTFIEHFAVSPAKRNQGLGTQILAWAHRTFPGQLCLEAELPETELASRRIAFYRRNGFYANSYPYLQPAYSLETMPVPMRILTSVGPVSQERFEQIRTALYRHVYKIDSF